MLFCILKLLRVGARLIVKGITDALGISLRAVIDGQVIPLFLWFDVLRCLLGH